MKIARLAAAGATALLLWGCFLTPGRFDAALDLRRDGSFSYRYEGEVLLLTPQGAMAMAAEAETFDPKAQRCTDAAEDAEEDALETGADRACTPAEIETRRQEWEKRQAEQKAQMETMRGFFGGLDPNDPATVAEFTRRLTTYQGWKRVVHKGNGLFDVLYEMKGRTDRDFVFPVFPEIDVVVPFVRISRRADGALRVDAPAFAQNEEAMSGAGLGAVMAAQAASKGGTPPAYRRPEGRFTITTDGEVLTNNTENGASAGAAGARQLRWTVGPLDKKKPEALIRL
jgi:hypothetical protein